MNDQPGTIGGDGITISGETFFVDFLSQALPHKGGPNSANFTGVLQELRWERHKMYPNEQDHVRVAQLMEVIDQVAHLPDGDYVEMGTLHGGTARIIWRVMRPMRHLYCFDTWDGFDQAQLDRERSIWPHGWTTESFHYDSMEKVRQTITGGIPCNNLSLVKGKVPDCLPAYDHLRFRFAHLDMDLFDPTFAAIHWLWPRMVPGGIMVFHDYGVFPGVRGAVDQCFRPTIVPLPMGDKLGSAMVFRPGVTTE